MQTLLPATQGAHTATERGEGAAGLQHQRSLQKHANFALRLACHGNKYL